MLKKEEQIVKLSIVLGKLTHQLIVCQRSMLSDEVGHEVVQLQTEVVNCFDG